MIKVQLPFHLRRLANIDEQIEIEIAPPITIAHLIDSIEESYPALRGTIRDPLTRERRAFLRFFACGEDISHQPLDTNLPDSVLNGNEPLMVVGAIAGG